ncbi:uncharacterized protein CTRU02_209782 [Colletotrichum truncatum]|uniref:Uncharacterized protein n=1 Tax=Colletotrichum truncatum TaxID=5467 RepID=A0ACC3YTE4_COLTU|nr:uncharacterized protein CTRU02_02356 [Colletotrichum truncatum]KAF6798382.1 hypothetical protein CTRU02_02356 [Colletotrichum truncatum]
MAEVMKRRSGREIPCYTQEPDYTHISRRFLQNHDFTVLDGVKGFLEVDDTTLVFTCSPNVPVKQIVAELARPAIIVWDADKMRLRREARGEAEAQVDGFGQGSETLRYVSHLP